MNNEDTFVGLSNRDSKSSHNSEEVTKNLPELPAFIVDNPFDADEIVWLTREYEKAEVMIKQLTTPHRAEKRIYIVEPTAKLNELYNSLAPTEFKNVDVSSSRPFVYRNAGLKTIDRIVALLS